MTDASTSTSSAPVLLFILGMHRSGTSALTRVMELIGFRNAEDLMPANAFNKPGYFEANAAVEINDRFMQRVSSFWFDPASINFPALKPEMVENFTAQARAFLEDEFTGTSHYVIKDPRIAKTFPIWRAAAEQAGFDVKCMIACRHPYEVAGSLARRDVMAKEHALDLWQGYMLDSELYTRGLSRIAVFYDEIMMNWRQVLNHAFGELGMDFSAFTGRDENAIDAFLSYDHRNFHEVLPKNNGHLHSRSPSIALYDCFRRHRMLGATDKFNTFRDTWQVERKVYQMPKGVEYALTFPVGIMWQADKLSSAGKKVEAEALLLNGIEKFPKFGRLREAAVKALLKNDKTDAALEMLEELIETHGETAEALYLMGDVLARKDNAPYAIASLERALEMQPNAPHVHHLLGNIYLSEKKFDAAEAEFRAVIKTDKSRPMIYSGLSQALYAQGKLDEAKDALEAAIKLAPKNAGFYNRLGQMLFQADQFEAAEAAYRQAIQRDDTRAHFYAGLGQALVRMERFDQAVESVRKASELAPKNAEYHHRLGRLLTRTGELDEAKSELETAISLNNKKPPFYRALSDVARKLGDETGAAEAERKADALVKG